MTQADKHFIDTCKKIITEGYSSEGTGVRTRWEDGSEANYFSIVGVTNVYDVGKEFPMITLRNNSQTVKRAIDEILWIWQKKSNNIKDLNSHIWDQWADENGTIGKAYGYQLGKKYQFKTKEGIKEMDQVDYVLYLLKNDPASRRIMTNIFNHEELKDMRLEPCAYGINNLYIVAPPITKFSSFESLYFFSFEMSSNISTFSSSIFISASLQRITCFLFGNTLPNDSKVFLPIIIVWLVVNLLNLFKSSGKCQIS